ncbi:MAG: hypothetical protein V9G29_14965 [Burkholderiaceae bacterium]
MESAPTAPGARRLEPRPGGRRHRNAGLERAGRIGELDLDALGPRGIQPLAQLRSTAPLDEMVEVGSQCLVGRNRSVEAAEDLALVIGDVLDDLCVALHAQLDQQIERRGLKQLREPGVEGADLDRTAGALQSLLQAGKRWRELLRGGGVDSALLQGLDSLRLGADIGRQRGQPLGEPGPHLAGRLARERDRKDLLWLGTVEQRAQDA